MRNFEKVPLLSGEMMIRNFVRGSVNNDPFLRNFTPALTGEKRVVRRVAEGIILDVVRPGSEVSYLLIGGIPGSGKTSLADAVADIIPKASLGLCDVERRSFVAYREKAKRYMAERGEVWTKESETAYATMYMKQEALEVIGNGPVYDEYGRRRIIVAEMPIYTVDEKERGMEVIKAIGEAISTVPYDKRRARTNFVMPDLDVIDNAMVTRMLKMSAGGTPDMIAEIAYKAYAGALLFGEISPALQTLANTLFDSKPAALRIFQRLFKPEALSRVEASNMIAFNMLAILVKNGLYGQYDSVLTNPSRRSLVRLSRKKPQRSLVE